MPESGHSATRGFYNRMAIVFDFDRTLSAGTVDALLDRMGVDDKDGWREARLQPMIEDGWDEILAKADCSPGQQRSKVVRSPAI